MVGVVLVGHGGFNKLEYRLNIPVPKPGPDEVLIRVAAAGVNNTDINTRIGWYSKSVKASTGEAATQAQDADATWTGAPMSFPRIQGADCCGRIVSVGNNVDPRRVGERVINANTLRFYVNYRPMESWVFGSECDGAFAQYMKAPSCEAHKVDCDWSDVELASVSCSYSTAENLLHRAGLKPGEHVVITGASGGVGSAAVQLAKRREAFVTAVAGPTKANEMRKLGADRVIARGESLTKHLGKESVDVVVDVVAGPAFADLLDVLKKGGRYAVGGAIAGPIVELDVRTLYLKDLTFFGCTFQDDAVFKNLVSYIERGEVHPFVGKTFPLKNIAEAQQEFLSKTTSGKLVLIIPD
ncbi:alcohol dehydrogenase family protein [Mesorhizobium sp. NZP2077]|uniref:alcohol dehydrogenase family protein n=1 Tax=Mesorhizobium sp. NZP2077 TaxID=2483404 RepID=UPI001FEEB1BA|nr:alcohol dehydrogenase family protein [Mesorhizobium sp. NZP2077]